MEVAVARYAYCKSLLTEFHENPRLTIGYRRTVGRVKFAGKAFMYEGWNFNSGNYLFTTDTK